MAACIFDPSVKSTDLGKIICRFLGPESSEPSQQSTSPLDKLEEVRTSTFISEELLLTPSEPLFNWSLEMTTMSEPFLPDVTQPLELLLDLRIRRTMIIATKVTMRPTMTPDNTMTRETESEIRKEIILLLVLKAVFFE